jgi:TolB protein
MMDADGRTAKVLTNEPGFDGIPSWSPDGQYLAFQSNRAGINDIYILNLKGEIVKQISLTGQDASEPVWKP